MLNNIHAGEARIGDNQILLQGFEWYSPGHIRQPTLDEQSGIYEDAVQSHWQTLRMLLPQLRSLGVTSLWIPPACKATGPSDNGYGIYDLWDLGEFDCKGSTSTKWGSKESLHDLCQSAQEIGIGIVFDAVLNHKAAADEAEIARAVRVNPKDRMQVLDRHVQEIECWTKFHFAQRDNKYSSMTYNKAHFSGVDWDASTRQKAIFKFIAQRPDGTMKDWATDVDCGENGNYDYLMFADVDYSHPDVRHDVRNWGAWLVEQLPAIRGMRLDAVKHYSAGFQNELVQHIKNRADRDGRNFFFVGEYWRDDARLLQKYLRSQHRSVTLFDVPLLYNLHNISTGKLRDLRKMFCDTLVELEPNRAITFVTNHDTQEGQSLQAPIEPWFIPHAYALILLRKSGLPCVFWGDLFGTSGPRPRQPACGGKLVRLFKARQLFAYGEQVEQQMPRVSAASLVKTSKRKQIMSWMRRFSDPTSGRRIVMVVVLSISWSWEQQKVHVGSQSAGEVFSDMMGWCWSGVKINEQGIGVFPVGPRSISVWTCKDLAQRSEIDNLFFPASTASDSTESSTATI